eukprot:SAG22_NODE_20386_length_266_cov_0.616766_2_plen_26_part_01
MTESHFAKLDKDFGGALELDEFRTFY